MAKMKVIEQNIIVRTQFVALHRWADAPNPVAFLRNYHRHVFHVELILSVTHSDRELEFFMVKADLDDELKVFQDPPDDEREHKEKNNGYREWDMSCEMFAREILWAMRERGYKSAFRCSVFEDGENGAMVECEL